MLNKRSLLELKSLIAADSKDTHHTNEKQDDLSIKTNNSGSSLDSSGHHGSSLDSSGHHMGEIVASPLKSTNLQKTLLNKVPFIFRQSPGRTNKRYDRIQNAKPEDLATADEHEKTQVSSSAGGLSLVLQVNNMIQEEERRQTIITMLKTSSSLSSPYSSKSRSLELESLEKEEEFSIKTNNACSSLDSSGHHIGEIVASTLESTNLQKTLLNKVPFIFRQSPRRIDKRYDRSQNAKPKYLATADEQEKPRVSSSDGSNNKRNPSDTSSPSLLQVNNMIQEERRQTMNGVEDLVAQLRAEFMEERRQTMNGVEDLVAQLRAEVMEERRQAMNGVEDLVAQLRAEFMEERRQTMNSVEEDLVAQLRAEVKDVVQDSIAAEIQIEQGSADYPPLVVRSDGSGGTDSSTNSSNYATRSTFNIENDGERERHVPLPEDTGTTRNTITISRTTSVTRTISFLTRTALNIESDAEQHVSLPGDTFSLMIVSKAGTSPWLAGFGIFVVQMALLVFLCLEMFFDGNFLAQFPLKVDPLVSCAQFFVLLAIFFLQADLVEAARNLFVLSDENVRDLLAIEDDTSTPITRASFMFSNVLKLTMAIITIAVSVALVVRSTTSLELLKDFAALMVISQIDNLVFTLFVKNGVFGLESKKKADEITMRSVIADITTGRGRYRMDVLIISCIYFVAVISWIVILVLQLNGTIARAKGCNVDRNKLGDGKCDDGLYNTGVCGWDVGDCMEVNQKYPLCRASNSSKIGNGECDSGEYNTEKCGWDGGDCCEVDEQWRIGDGSCDGGDYDTAECLWDGGDCIVSDEYPRCRVDAPSQIGNRECDGGDYNTEECGWDGGDCCSDVESQLLGDGICNGGVYNTEECVWDRGDCFEFNTKYPHCKVDVPNDINNGECDGGDYDSEECGWDGGDCIVSDKYPRCRVDVPSQIGNGECDGGDYNTEECGWDDGDCCSDVESQFLGDGTCSNFAPYNTEECLWDRGDCLEFNTKYPNCEARYPSAIGDGTCQHYAPYNTEECGWDGGDCKGVPGYPNCHVGTPSAIGDGKCHLPPYNTSECGWDGGDCL